MSREDPLVRKVERVEAIRHSLWEAQVCIVRLAICGSLAMLRKAVDLWSADYRDRHGLTFDATAGERDNVYWRLQKIAGANPLYRDSIHEIVDGLRLDANDAIHEPVVCRGGHAVSLDAAGIAAIQAPALKLSTFVSQLIATTMRGVVPTESDVARLRSGQGPPA